MNIGIVPNPKRPEAMKLCNEVAERISGFGMVPYIPKEFDSLAVPGAERSNNNELFGICDIIITVGGDGTIIRWAKFAAPLGKPVLGINAGRIGYLATLESNELDKLVRLKTGDYTVENRIMLKIIHNGKAFYALNDAVISRGPQSKIADLVVGINGQNISYRADAIIAATPTGSTAYSLSAGGPVLEPGINNIVISPVCPHALFARSLVLNGDSIITVTSKGNDREVFLSVDGGEAEKVISSDKIIISRAEYVTKIISIDGLSFYDVLSRKLR